jgi:thiopeptide-type bacteriocin biosynthesis protein
MYRDHRAKVVVQAPSTTDGQLSAAAFVLRTPLLPFHEWLDWSAGLEAAGAVDDEAALTEALARDRARLRERLRDALAPAHVREAIFLASPDLDESFEHWLSDPGSKRGEKIERALVRYFGRLTGRATPFGLFAGCSLGRLGDRTRLTLDDRAGYHRHSRLDMDYLALLVDALGRDPAVRKLVTYRPNSSLYHAAGRVRYVESRQDEKERSYHLVAVEPTEYLDTVIKLAAAGARPEMLAQALVSDEVSRADALAYIHELIDNQALVPDLALTLTGPEPIDPLVQALRQNEATTATAELLARAGDELAALDTAGLGMAPDRYRALGRRLESLPAKIELARLFQVDLIKPAPELTLGAAVLAELEGGVELLQRLAGRPRDNALTRFREVFVKRYEEREVPLVEALDDDAGIGFPVNQSPASPLLQGLSFPPEPDPRVWLERDDFLLRKLTETHLQGSQELVLEKGELEALAAKEPLPLPDAFAVTAVLAAGSQEALDQGDFRVLLEGAGGPSGARLLGRFCHADPSLKQEVERHLRAEEALRSDGVFAEIVHLPQGRIGNISARPVLRDYEIPYLGHSGAPAAQQLPITDLHLSVRGGRLILRSARLNREVIPRLTNAHNYFGHAFGAYRFLCLLQDQGTAAGLSWDWGALQSAPFLPRVTTGRLVLARARWRLHKDELRRLGKTEGSARFRAVQSLRTERRLPRLAALADFDNTLPIDFDNVLSVETFVHAVKERDEATLIELFPTPDQLCVHGREGKFVHELIVPFVKKSVASVNGSVPSMNGQRREGNLFSPLATRQSHSDCKRRFTPGSEWLFVKLYTGMTAADQVLRELVAPLRAEALRTGAADRWFFIRYSDPDWHLRLRFHGKPERLYGEILPALDAAVAPLLQDDRLWRVELETYEREVERYAGALGIDLAERIFQVDSEAVLELLELFEPGDEGMDERWRLALCGVHALLADFGFDISERRLVLEKYRAGLAKEMRVEKEFEQKLSARFRKERQSLQALIDPDGVGDNPLAPGLEVLANRSKRLAPLVAELKAAAQAANLSRPLPDLASSIIHMHVNRLLRSEPRKQELVLYDFLLRLYGSAIARAAESQERPRATSHGRQASR